MKKRCRSVTVKGQEWHYAVRGEGFGTYANIYRPGQKTVAAKVGIRTLVPNDTYWSAFDAYGSLNDCAFPGIGPGDVKNWIRSNMLGASVLQGAGPESLQQGG